MLHRDRLPALAILTALVAWTALGLQWWLLVDSTRAGLGPLLATIKFLSYFTILSNLLVAIVTTLAVFSVDAGRTHWLGRPRVRAAVALYIGVTGTVYFVVLRHLWQPQGAQWWADTGLHYATPVLYLAWYLPQLAGRLQWRDLALWLLFPLGYLGWALLHGEWSGDYAYPFLDLNALSGQRVLVNATGICGLFVALGAVLIAWDRIRGRTCISP